MFVVVATLLLIVARSF